jgi:release factor glutamine methyltransferase
MTGVHRAPPAPTAPVDVQSRLVASLAGRLGSVREATWIVEHAAAARATGSSRHEATASDNRPGEGCDPLVGQGLEREAQGMADRRAAGEPLQYVLGNWPFRSLELTVDPRVLIPRPETEQVVEVALGELDRICASPRSGDLPDDDPNEHVAAAFRACVDLGTGSGAIALSLAVEGGDSHPGLQVWATDRSADALQVAHENLRTLDASNGPAASRVRLVEGSWFDALPSALAGQVDLVVSNPPYVAESEYPYLDPTVRDWEPRSALVAARGADGVEGMAAIEAIVAGAPRWLHRSGAIVIEIAPGQADASIHAARRAGFGRATVGRDLAGRPRMLVASL